jgi:glycosyltransferase involved in cell wall biosynthesis
MVMNIITKLGNKFHKLINMSNGKNSSTMNILIMLPVPLPGVGGLETHYNEIINYFSRFKTSIVLICPKYIGDKNVASTFETKMKKRNVKTLNIPISAPNLYYEKANFTSYVFLIIKILIFWTFSTFCTVFAVKKYRPKSCLMRHSLLLFPVPCILKIFRIRVIGDGDAFSSSGIYFFFKLRTSAKRHTEKNGLMQNTIFLRSMLHILEKVEHIMFKNYDYFRVISPFLASDPQLKKFISDEKIIMIPPAIDTSSIPYFPNSPNDIAYFGILEKFEGLEILIKSFARVLIRHPSVKLHIFGDGPLRRKLQEMVRELNIDSSVIFYGNLPRDKLFLYFNKFSIAVFPRVCGYGHIPIKIIEALAAGKAIIATKVAGISDIFSSDEIMFIEPNDETQLAEAIIKLLENQKMREKLSQHGRLKSKQFDASRIYNELFNIVDCKSSSKLNPI